MKYKNCAPADLDAAAATLPGIRVHHPGPNRFTLKTEGPRPPYRRIAQRPPHRTVPGAVCWHGHRDFFRALFERCPDAVISSALATYNGAADFEAKFPQTRQDGGDYFGAAMLPYDQACACHEDQP